MAGKSSPEAMDRMINNITKFIQVQQSVAQSLKSDYIAVGEEWDDKQYQNLGAVIAKLLQPFPLTMQRFPNVQQDCRFSSVCWRITFLTRFKKRGKSWATE